MKAFRVLVIDDSLDLIQRLKDRISRVQTIAGTTWDVLVEGVHIQVDHDDDGVRFSDTTLNTLVAACHHKPDLILADYGYNSPMQAEMLHSKKLSPAAYLDQILSARHIASAVEAFVQKNRPGDKRMQQEVRSSLRDNPCRLYLYTYTSKKYRHSLPTVDARCKLTRESFPRCDLRPVDISEQIYENGKYDVDSPTDNDKEFRAYLTAGLLEQLVQRELLEFILRRESGRLKYVRFARSGFGVSAVVLVGGAFGAVGEWFGSRLMAALNEGHRIEALEIGVLVAILFFIFGLSLPLFFEHVMTKLLRQPKSEDPNDVE